MWHALPPGDPRARGRRRGRRRDGRPPPATRSAPSPTGAARPAVAGVTEPASRSTSCPRARRSTSATASASRSTCPGSIQPRGVLIAVSDPDFVVQQVSENLADLIGVDVAGGAGPAARPRCSAWPRPRRSIRSASAFGDLRERNPVEITLDVDGDPVPGRRAAAPGGHRAGGPRDRARPTGTRPRCRLEPGGRAGAGPRSAALLLPEHLPGGARHDRRAQPGLVAAGALRHHRAGGAHAHRLRPRDGLPLRRRLQRRGRRRGQAAASSTRSSACTTRPRTSRPRRGRCTRRTGSG